MEVVEQESHVVPDEDVPREDADEEVPPEDADQNETSGETGIKESIELPVTLATSDSIISIDLCKDEDEDEDQCIPSGQGEIAVSTSSDSSYLQELENEKEQLNPRCLHTIRLLEDEVNRIHVQFDEAANDFVNLSEKIYFPVDKYPNSNFALRLLGPRGSTMKGITAYTKTRISILGKGSTRDSGREEDLRKNPRNSHLNEPLHVVIQTAGPKYLAESRLKSAKKEIELHIEKEISSVKSIEEELPDPYASRRPFDNDPHAYVNLKEKYVVPLEGSKSTQFILQLLGPRGQNLRSIATSTKTRISILGRGSTRDQKKEEELRKSDDHKHQHFKEPLHILIQLAGPRQTSQVRINAALREIKSYVEEVSNDKPAGGQTSNFDGTVNLKEKIFLPVDKYPVNNFIGKLLGPKGSVLKSIAANTRTRISILGKGSSKKLKDDDPSNEQEPLHVLIQTAGPSYVVQGRVSAAIAEINRHIDEEINRIIHLNTSTSPTTHRRPFDNEEQIEVYENVFFPVDEYPTFNFVGKLIGHKGVNLKAITASNQFSNTKTKISVLGKGSMRDSRKEAELLQSNDPKYQHLKKPLHVEVLVTGPKHSVQVKLKSAVSDIKKYTDPEYEKKKDNYIPWGSTSDLELSNNRGLRKMSFRSDDDMTTSSRYDYDSKAKNVSADYNNYTSKKNDKSDYTWQGTSSPENNSYGRDVSSSYINYTREDDRFENNNHTYSSKRSLTSDNGLSLPEKRYRDSHDIDQPPSDSINDVYGNQY